MHEYDFVFNSGDWMHVGDFFDIKVKLRLNLTDYSTYTDPVPLFVNHECGEHVGSVLSTRLSGRKLVGRVGVTDGLELGRETIHKLNNGMLRSCSVGVYSDESLCEEYGSLDEQIENKSLHLDMYNIELYELSLTPLPADRRARLFSVGDRRVGSSHSNSGMRYVRGILTKRG